MSAYGPLTVFDADLESATNLVDLILIAAAALGRLVDVAAIDQDRARGLAGELLATIGLDTPPAAAEDERHTEAFAPGTLPPRGTVGIGYHTATGRH